MQHGKGASRRVEEEFREWVETRQQLEKNMKQLYWVAVLYRKGKKTELIVEPEIMLAASEEKAKAGMINRIPSSYKERFDRLEVVVRPF